MSDLIPKAEFDFFPKLLERITNAFKAGDTCIVECIDNKSGEKSKVLALIQLNEVNRKIELYPIARLYNSNPMEGIRIVDGGVLLASQVPMSKWVEKSKEKLFDPSQMN